MPRPVCNSSRGKCKQTCVEACGERNAFDFNQQERIEEYEVGAIVIATGFKAFDPSVIPYYGYGKYPNVYTSLEVERLINAGGPTSGKFVLRDGSTPKRVAIIHCVGSRDANYHAYCSRVCCMYSLKLAHLVREKTEAEIFNCYIDIRTPGKGFEEFYNRVQDEGVQFIRGKVADITPVAGTGTAAEGGLVMQVDDTLLGSVRKINVDMVILAVALEPQRRRRRRAARRSAFPALPKGSSWSGIPSWPRSTRPTTASSWPAPVRGPRTFPTRWPRPPRPPPRPWP